MNTDANNATSSLGFRARRDRERDDELSGSVISSARAEERPWWALGDWRSAVAEPEFVLA
jgi:hypothetical protein